MPGTGVKCDLDRVDLKCPGRKQLLLDFETGLGPETGSGALGWEVDSGRFETGPGKTGAFWCRWAVY